MFNLPLAATWELVQTKFRSSFRFARLFSYLGACSARAAAWNQVYPYTARAFHRELVQTVPRCTGNSIALRFRAGHCVQAQPAAGHCVQAQPAAGRACGLSLPPGA